jgi:phage minor structural protein, N-terminal region
MIKLFKSTDLTFDSNGDKIINATKAIVHKEDNGDFYLDFECDLSYINDIVENNILVANTPQGDQAFRIGNVSKTKYKITTKAKHVFYDSQNYLIADSYVVDKDCAGAMYHLNASTEPTSPFATFSDITAVGSFRCVRKSLYEALKTVQERWGGHFIRDNFSIGLRSEIGVDSDVVVRYRKNIQDITCEENWDDVVTKLLPVGKDGILLNKLDPNRSIYLTSTQKYDVPFTKTISFNQDNISEEDFTDEDGILDEVAYYTALIEDLERQGEEYLLENSVPKISYTLKANLDTITDIGDKIKVIHEPLNLSLTASVIAYDYNCILKKYTELSFGNFGKTLTGLLSNITQATNEAITEQTNYLQTAFSNEIDASVGEIWDLLDGSYVVYQGEKILVVDSLPKEDAINVLKIDKSGVSLSNNGIHGIFHNVWNIDGFYDFTPFNYIKWGVMDLGKASNSSGKIKLFSSANELFAEFSQNGVKLYCKNKTYVTCNKDYVFAVYDKNDNLLFL